MNLLNILWRKVELVGKIHMHKVNLQKFQIFVLSRFGLSVRVRKTCFVCFVLFLVVYVALSVLFENCLVVPWKSVFCALF